jgi:hypothetical protein
MHLRAPPAAEIVPPKRFVSSRPTRLDRERARLLLPGHAAGAASIGAPAAKESREKPQLRPQRSRPPASHALGCRTWMYRVCFANTKLPVVCEHEHVPAGVSMNMQSKEDESDAQHNPCVSLSLAAMMRSICTIKASGRSREQY